MRFNVSSFSWNLAFAWSELLMMDARAPFANENDITPMSMDMKQKMRSTVVVPLISP